MTALKIIGIILLIFLLLGFVRVGAHISFDGALRVRARVGVLWLAVYPRAPKKTEDGRKEKKAEPEKPKKTRKGLSLPKPAIDELIDLLETALSALGDTARRFCRRLCVDPLELTVTFAGDPARAAERYGKASAAMYALMPRLEACFHIPDPSLHLRLDYTAESTSVAGRIGVSLRVCDLLALAFTLAPPLFKWYLRFRRAHRRDEPAHRGGGESAEAETTTENKIA